MEEAVAPEVGELLYLLAVACRPRTAVEFGCSVGVSTIYLAAALRDLGAGALITTELDAAKAARAGRNLADAGLSDLVDLRVGDALESLHDLPAPVDLLFLDGANRLYLSVLEVVEPSLADRALVLADMSADDPDSQRYRERVTHAGSVYRSVELPLDDGVIVSWHAAGVKHA